MRAKQARGVCRGGRAGPARCRTSQDSRRTHVIPALPSVIPALPSSFLRFHPSFLRRQESTAPFVPDERGACERSKHAGYARGGRAGPPDVGHHSTLAAPSSFLRFHPSFPRFHPSFLRRQESTAPFVPDERGACERSKHAGYARGGRGAATRQNHTPTQTATNKPPSPWRKGARVSGAIRAGDARGGEGHRRSPHHRNPRPLFFPRPPASFRRKSESRGVDERHPAPFAPSERGACERSKHAGYARGGRGGPPDTAHTPTPSHNNIHPPNPSSSSHILLILVQTTHLTIITTVL